MNTPCCESCEKIFGGCLNPSCPSCHSLPKTGEKCHGRNCRKCNGGDSSECYLSDNTPSPKVKKCEWNPFCPDKLLCDKHKPTPQLEKKCDHEEGFRCNRCRDTQIVNNDFKKPTSEKKKCGCVGIGKPYPKYCSKHLKEHITPPPLASDWEFRLKDMVNASIRDNQVRGWFFISLKDFIRSLLLRQQDEIVRKIEAVQEKIASNPADLCENSASMKAFVVDQLSDFITNIKNK